MKKILLALSATVLCANIALANPAADKRKDFATKSKEECSAGIAEMGMEKEKASKFCDCYVDNVMKVLTDKDIETLDKLADDAQPDKELAEKMEKAGAPCASLISGGE
ncbi:hypothetical protein DBR32_06580 [Taibaiella sp. KBW10]|uniref:hypothetical protein n=1 Tax=Taibaiella sp. KBW10 TaxID=2153357 RepID=UPI000F5A33FF|nr:hypothetical protein [Taibaiella sp. KBW10]RQO31614.1 hypothetical protein DBR32_06580 [Taibaiella sp. KBW10]